MKTKKIITIFLFLLISKLNAQVSGNSVQQNYQRNSNNNSKGILEVEKLFVTDSTFIVQANILKNIVADNYVAVFGVSEKANTLKECNENINKRIDNFISDLSKIGVNKKDIYVDMTTQTQIYDYKVQGEVAVQYINGFEIKKNVILKFKKISDLDKMVIFASNYNIYDLIKVDYMVSNEEEIYSTLFETAKNIIEKKKNLYVLATNVKLANTSQIFGEKFYSQSPQESYRSYTSNLSSTYTDFRSYDKRIDLAKSPTYYYDKLNYSGFDKVINPIVTEPAVAYVLSIKIKFKILK
ncbi:SIMPL domain-containing protein [Flavobacterium aquiphilum]|uniref:SIMPL domain-containing protein n=1 Tax=Flavobacterium aquiphilum TaxID=3003261 RepID=UPI00248077DA|nr:SIMPL domain-containing protein [Flavobacterium aquiphilum]